MALAFVVAACMVVSFLLTVNRVVPIRWVLGYASVVDVAFTVGVCTLAGSVTGLYAGVASGLLLTITMSIMRPVLGYWYYKVRWSYGVPHFTKIVVEPTAAPVIAAIMQRVRHNDTELRTDSRAS